MQKLYSDAVFVYSALVEEGTEKRDLIKSFNAWMKVSRHSKNFRMKVTKAALDKYDIMTENEIKWVR